MNQPVLSTLILLALFAPPSWAAPREDFKAAVEAVAKAPGDAALRQKAIALAKKVKPAPAVPEEAERRMARGAEFVSSAKSSADYLSAAAEFEAATLAAPWWGDAYYNLGVAYDKAGKPVQALAALKLAVTADPASKDVKTLMYRLEVRAEKARDPLRGLTGAWYFIDYPAAESADLATYWDKYIDRWSLERDGDGAVLWLSEVRFRGKTWNEPPGARDTTFRASVVNGELRWTGDTRSGHCPTRHKAPAKVDVLEDGRVILIRTEIIYPGQGIEDRMKDADFVRDGIRYRAGPGGCVILENFTYRLGRGK
jgi:tetratricopeptide (TPR) repeat protein